MHHARLSQPHQCIQSTKRCKTTKNFEQKLAFTKYDKTKFFDMESRKSMTTFLGKVSTSAVSPVKIWNKQIKLTWNRQTIRTPSTAHLHSSNGIRFQNRDGEIANQSNMIFACKCVNKTFCVFNLPGVKSSDDWRQSRFRNVDLKTIRLQLISSTRDRFVSIERNLSTGKNQTVRS